MTAVRPLVYAKLLGAMFLWGGTWIAGRIIAQEVATPLAAAALRFLLAGLALGMYAASTTEGWPAWPEGRQWGTVVGLALTGITLYALCFFYGLRHLPAGRGALVVALNPAVAVLVAWFLGSERMTPIKALGCLLALTGCLAVIGNGDPMALLHGAIGPGEWLILGCVVCWTAYTFIGRLATRSLSPLAATLFASLLGGLFLGAIALIHGHLDLATWSWRVWASVAFLAIGGTALAFTWFADGVKHLGAARASSFINLVPVFAVVQAALLLNEHLGLAVLVGGALVVAGVWLTNWNPRSSLLEKTA